MDDFTINFGPPKLAKTNGGFSSGPSVTICQLSHFLNYCFIFSQFMVILNLLLLMVCFDIFS